MDNCDRQYRQEVHSMIGKCLASKKNYGDQIGRNAAKYHDSTSICSPVKTYAFMQISTTLNLWTGQSWFVVDDRNLWIWAPQIPLVRRLGLNCSAQFLSLFVILFVLLICWVVMLDETNVAGKARFWGQENK